MKTYNNQETICIHAGTELVPDAPGVVPPIHPSTSYKYQGTGEPTYPRYFNTPNQQVVVEKICRLEGAEAGLLFASGMAAISTTFLGLLAAGDHVVLSNQLYGGTLDFVTHEFERLGVSHTLVNAQDIAEVRQAIQATTRLIHIETPSNPLLSVVDLAEIGAIGRANNILTMIDNTFASPVNQNPIAHGFDIVMHSGTKYLGGHSDICFGVIVTSQTLRDQIASAALKYGGSTNALDCYLIERSLKTLVVRVERQNENAQKIAEFLAEHPHIGNVFYPGLPTHPGHEIAKKQMRGFGGMLSFELVREDSKTVNSFVSQLSLIQASLSLGGVETVLCSPATTSHRELSKAERAKLGISDGLLRLSVGIEHIDDLIDDLDQALQTISVTETVAVPAVS